MMYSVSPKIAQKLKPVNESCVDNGIEMKVVAAEIQDNKATVLVTMRDTEGSRLDETTDLFDSYSINTPYDQCAGCSFVGYDADTNTATFLISIEQNDHILIQGDKVTFSVSQIISGKSHNKYRLNPISTDNVLKISEYLSDPPVRGSGGYDSEDIRLIIPDEKNAVNLEEGVWFTGIGIVDNELHIQIRYDDIKTTDNHGFVYLKNQDGKVVNCRGNVAFWDENYKNSYEEYVFSIPEAEIKEYEVWGEFWTCNNGPINGNWQVTIPLDKAD